MAVCAAMHTGRVQQQAHGKQVMANSWRKVTSTLSKKEVGTQSELLKKHVAIQRSGCRECQSFTPSLGSCRYNDYVRCEQVEDLVSMVAELQEEVEKLRGIWDSEGGAKL